jgi:hypothetical protein
MTDKFHFTPFRLCVLALILVTAIAAIVYFFGPYTESFYLCRMCGKQKNTLGFYGILLRDKESDTYYSEWWKRSGLLVHQHNWVLKWSTTHFWGGGWEHGDCHDKLEPLRFFLDASYCVDGTKFEELTQAYYAAYNDESLAPGFIKRCEKIMYDGGDAPSAQ